MNSSPDFPSLDIDRILQESESELEPVTLPASPLTPPEPAPPALVKRDIFTLSILLLFVLLTGGAFLLLQYLPGDKQKLLEALQQASTLEARNKELMSRIEALEAKERLYQGQIDFQTDVHDTMYQNILQCKAALQTYH